MSCVYFIGVGNLQQPFAVIGLTETKIKKKDSKLISNTSLQGYDFVSQPSLSMMLMKSGFHVKKGVKFYVRDDLSVVNNDISLKFTEMKLRALS